MTARQGHTGDGRNYIKMHPGGKLTAKLKEHQQHRRHFE